MTTIENQYDKLLTLLPYYPRSQKITCTFIVQKLRVGYPYAKRLLDRLSADRQIDNEGYPKEGPYPYAVALKDLKRTKRYCGRGMPYALPLGEDEHGRYLDTLPDVKSLFLEAEDGLALSNAFRVILTSLAVAGSLTKPRFLILDLKRVTFDPYLPYLALQEPVIKESGEVVKALKAVKDEESKKTPLIIVLPSGDDLLRQVKEALPFLKALARTGYQKNHYLIVGSKEGNPCLQDLEQACFTMMKLSSRFMEATLMKKNQKPRSLMVPTLSEDESVSLLQSLKKKRSKKHEQKH